MKGILLILSLFISLTLFAQPKGKQNPVQKQDTSGLSVNLPYKVVKDTLSAIIIVYDGDGYLQRKLGRVIRTMSVFTTVQIQPELINVLYLQDNGNAIKPEDVYDVKPRNIK